MNEAVKLAGHVRLARFLAVLLDSRFKIGRFSFGIDPLLSLIPGIGDISSFFLGTYIVWIGIRAKIPPQALVKMLTNLIVDFLIGLVPLIGDVGDFAFKANLKNLKILEEFTVANIQEAEIITP